MKVLGSPGSREKTSALCSMDPMHIWEEKIQLMVQQEGHDETSSTSSSRQGVEKLGGIWVLNQK